MIADRTTGRELRGNLSGQRIAMGVDESSIGHLMNVLTDLYSDPELAALREYATNARDAHICAGESRPIEIFLPTPLAPVLRIKDYGVGLTLEDLENIYSKYGASTKRGTNDQQGMLGLGCKSALTYSDQFTLVAIRDGVEVQVSVSRDEAGAGSLTVVDTRSTDAPNGVEVTIPAKRDNALEDKAREFFSYWEAGTVLVNGKEPARVDGLRLSDRLLLVTDHDAAPSYRVAEDRHRIVMGNVAYPAALDGVKLPHDRRLVAFVGIGEVNFTPSRESLHDTPTTRRTLEGLAREFSRDLDAAISRSIEGAADRPAAVAALGEWASLRRHSGTTYTWKGDALPDQFKAPDYQPGHPPTLRLVPGVKGYGPLNKNRIAATIPAKDWAGTVFVTGFNLADFSAVQRRKLDAWAEANARPEQWALIPAKALPANLRPWIDKARIVKWDTIRAIRTTAPSGGSGGGPVRGGVSGTYETWSGAGWIEHDADTIAGATDVFWTPLETHRLTSYPSADEKQLARRNESEAEYLARHHPGATVVRLPSNRVEKFCRLVPHAKNAPDAIAAEFSAWWSRLAPDTRACVEASERAGGRGSNADELATLPADRIDDPALAALVRAAHPDAKGAKAIERIAEWQKCRVGGLPDDHWEPDLDHYPVLEAIAGTYRYRRGSDEDALTDHLVLYMNAAYAARQKGSA